jgi:dGTPase
MQAISLQIPDNDNDPYVSIQKDRKIQVDMLKQLTWHYVIRDPALATQQHGQRRIIKGLFEMFLQCCREQEIRHFPRKESEAVA